MDLDRLKSFIQVIETGSFSLAAVALNITQSTMSSRIQALEAELNVVLFKRGRAGAALTKAGMELEAPARQIIEIWAVVSQTLAA